MSVRLAWLASSLAFFLAATSWLCPLWVLADDIPADKPAPVVAADASTPQGALLVFIRAMEAGDAQAAIAACQLRDDADADKEMLTAVTSATKAHSELRKAIKVKWADDAPGPEVQINGFTRIFSEYDFTEPTITEDGDTARAELRDKRGTICLTRQQDVWKISLEACMKDYSGYKPADVIKTFKEWEENATKMSERLAAGEFESFQAIQDDADKTAREASEQARKKKAAGL